MAVIHFLSPGFEDQVSGVGREEGKSGNPNLCMRLRKAEVSFSIKLTVSAASGGAEH
jgi:hypothetical protein